MNELENNNWEKDWQKAFEDASLTPPERVWANLDAHLDTQSPAPTDSRRRYAFYWLAALVLLFLSGWLGLEYFSSERSNDKTKDLASVLHEKKESTTAKENTLKNKKQVGDSQTTVSEKAEISLEKVKPNTVPPPEKVKAANRDLSVTEQQTVSSRQHKSSIKAISTKEELLNVNDKKRFVKTDNINEKQAPIDSKNSVAILSKTADHQENTRIVEPQKNEIYKQSSDVAKSPSGSLAETNETSNSQVVIDNKEPEVTEPSRVFVEADFLKNRSLNPYSIALLLPSLAYQNQSPIQPSKKKSASFSIGFRVMAASFNPNVRLLENAASANASLTQGTSAQTQNSLASESSTSLMADLHLNYKINERWFLAGGFQYLQGNAILENSALFINRTNSQRSSLYAGLIANNTNKTSSPSFSNDNLVLNSGATLALSSRFEYLSMPVSIGYQLRPLRRMGLSLSAGFSGDIFLKNTIGSNDLGSLNAEIYRPSDGVYRCLNLSGQMGLGLSYQLTKRWSASFESLYRKALFNGLIDGSSVKIHPRAIGAGLGVNYEF